MPKLKELRLQARLSVAELSRLANIDRKTVERAESGKPIQDVKAYALVATLSQHLNRDIQLEDVTDLSIL